MLPSDSPFPCYWWGIGLEDVGLSDVRPDVGTYGRYEFEQLPPLPFELRGDFAWLTNPPFDAHSIADQEADANAAALVRLRESSARLGVRLPDTFTRFMDTPALQQRIRSHTYCF